MPFLWFAVLAAAGCDKAAGGESTDARTGAVTSDWQPASMPPKFPEPLRPTPAPPDVPDAPSALMTAVRTIQKGKEVAIVGANDAERWDPNCLVRRGCTQTPGALRPCAASAATRAWSSVLVEADQFVGQKVRVRGSLVVGSRLTTLVGCTSPRGLACCNGSSGQVVLAGAPQALLLDGLFCAGDESAMCCNTPAYGQPVVAEGRLVHLSAAPPAARWKLVAPVLCSEPGAP
jgi:hypothetical protein